MELKTTPNSVSPRLWNPRRQFIGIKGTRGQGTRCGPKRRARRGHQVLARAAIKCSRARRIEPRAVLSVPCQFLSPVLVLQPLVLTKSASLVNVYLNKPLITN